MYCTSCWRWFHKLCNHCYHRNWNSQVCGLRNHPGGGLVCLRQKKTKPNFTLGSRPYLVWDNLDWPWGDNFYCNTIRVYLIKINPHLLEKKFNVPRTACWHGEILELLDSTSVSAKCKVTWFETVAALLFIYPYMWYHRHVTVQNNTWCRLQPEIIMSIIFLSACYAPKKFKIHPDYM